MLYGKINHTISREELLQEIKKSQLSSSSAEHFPHGKEFKTILENAGFENIDIKMLSMGIVNIYSASPRCFSIFCNYIIHFYIMFFFK